jgi:hypothetical protein
LDNIKISAQELCHASTAKFLLFFASLALMACKLASLPVTGTVTPGNAIPRISPITPAWTATAPVPSLRPQVTNIPAVTLATPTPAIALSHREPLADLAAIIKTPDWAELDLPQGLAEKWEDYADGRGELADAEKADLANFIAQWQQLDRLAQNLVLPADAVLRYRSRVIEVENQATGRIVLYAAQKTGEALPGPEEHPFMFVREQDGAAVGLLEAPDIPGLQPRIDATGRYVEYIDSGSQKVLLRADAQRLKGDSPGGETLKAELEAIYSEGSPYSQNAIYPRYYFPVDGIEAGFYTLEESLTYHQILQMNEAFDLYNRPRLQPLKSALFGAGVSVVVVERLKIASGLTYAGTGIIELDRQELFGNKYYLAEVLAHEGAHVLQGALSRRDQCDELLRREVGNQTIPPEFYDWSAEELIEQVQAGQVGAYHVSLWMLTQMGIKGAEISWLQDLIRTGSANGHSLLFDCP